MDSTISAAKIMSVYGGAFRVQSRFRAHAINGERFKSYTFFYRAGWRRTYPSGWARA